MLACKDTDLFSGNYQLYIRKQLTTLQCQWMQTFTWLFIAVFWPFAMAAVYYVRCCAPVSWCTVVDMEIRSNNRVRHPQCVQNVVCTVHMFITCVLTAAWPALWDRLTSDWIYHVHDSKSCTVLCMCASMYIMYCAVHVSVYVYHVLCCACVSLCISCTVLCMCQSMYIMYCTVHV